MNANEIVLYLQQNPDFFDNHADLLAQLTVPHPADGRAISLTERQLHALREKIRQLEGKFAELLRFGEENDQISEKVHRLVLALIEAEDFESIRQAILLNLLEDFSVPHVAMRVWNSVLSREGPEFSPVSEAVRFFAGDLRSPYCGPPSQPEVTGWFGEAAGRVRSTALMPLRRGAQVFGLLALGSEEPERFYPEMGTLYLGRIGDMVSLALLRQLG
ncbi:MAG: DUF484 family protein [Zoogloeaceae bacterium]|nr:DUF484 family protein [Zoogloeaceae bacterium]